jgi:hypothetical protein
MKLKTGVSVVLLLFVAAAVATLAVRGINRDNSAAPAAVREVPADVRAGRTSPAAGADAYEVFYFMTSQRCENCINFEKYTTEVLNTSFSEPMREQKLAWTIINLDEPQNRHFIQDYQLFTKSIVLVRYQNGMQAGWKNLDQIWNLVGDKASFQTYIAAEMKAFMGEQG